MFNGILPPLPTPFKEDGALDLMALRSNVEQLNILADSITIATQQLEDLLTCTQPLFHACDSVDDLV